MAPDPEVVDVSPGCVRIGPYRFARAAFSHAEAADLLCVTPEHTRNMAKAGEIRAVRLGHRSLIPATEIARILDSAPQGVRARLTA